MTKEPKNVGVEKGKVASVGMCKVAESVVIHSERAIVKGFRAIKSDVSVNGGWLAAIDFCVTNENGTFVRDESRLIPAEEFNALTAQLKIDWTQLYAWKAAKDGVSAPEDCADEFIN